MLTDPISDMLSRIKNGYMARKTQVSFPFSKMKLAIAKILKDNGYIGDIKEEGDKKKEILVQLVYKNGKPAISQIKRVSKPGKRVYAGAQDLKLVLGGYGVSIVSTSVGIMTNKEARKANAGGEIICEVY